MATNTKMDYASDDKMMCQVLIQLCMPACTIVSELGTFRGEGKCSH